MPRYSSKIWQITSYLILAFALVMVVGITRNCSRVKPAPLQGHSGGDTLDVAILYAPGSLYAYSDSITGMNAEIARIYSEATGTPVKIWPVADAAAAMSEVENGAFDILASIPLDNNIKNRFNTSESVFLDRLVLVQLLDSAAQSPKVSSSLDLNGKTVIVASGSPAVQRLDNLSNEIGGKIIVEEDEEISDELLCLKVANGTVPLAVVNEKTAREVAKKYPALSYDSPVSFTQFQVWLFNSADSLQYHKFNNWLKTFKATDFYRLLLNKTP